MGMVKRFSAAVRKGGDPGPAIVGALRAAEAFAGEAGVTGAPAARLIVCVEELVSNALRHGGSERDIALELELRFSASAIELRLTDDGVPFDPTARSGFAGPDPETGGGVGIELVRRWASEMSYLRDGERNRLHLVLPRD